MNPIGTILLEVARPALGPYAARLHDLNGLITLVNLKRAIRVAGVEPAGLEAFVLQAGHLGAPGGASGPQQVAQRRVLVSSVHVWMRVNCGDRSGCGQRGVINIRVRDLVNLVIVTSDLCDRCIV